MKKTKELIEINAKDNTDVLNELGKAVLEQSPPPKSKTDAINESNAKMLGIWSISNEKSTEWFKFIQDRATVFYEEIESEHCIVQKIEAQAVDARNSSETLLEAFKAIYQDEGGPTKNELVSTTWSFSDFRSALVLLISETEDIRNALRRIVSYLSDVGDIADDFRAEAQEEAREKQLVELNKRFDELKNEAISEASAELNVALEAAIEKMNPYLII